MEVFPVDVGHEVRLTGPGVLRPCRSKHWIKVKNRKRAAFDRVMEAHQLLELGDAEPPRIPFNYPKPQPQRT